MQHHEAIPRRVLAAALLLAPVVAGCIGNRVRYPIMPDDQQLLEFEGAGPVHYTGEDIDVIAFQVTGGEYRVVVGDLLSFELPREITTGESGSEEVDKVRSRVREDGTIKLPLLEAVVAVGKTLAEIELDLVNAYHPTYVREKPNVVVSIDAYHTANVAVLGAVANPGIVGLRSDRMSVFGALMESGGIDATKGAEAIRVLTQDGADGDAVVLPVRDANIPFSDMPLKGGETLVVEPLSTRNFTVVGLVNRSGSFSYPPRTSYNLMQALAIAGGTNPSAAPRFATIYRKKPSGEVLSVTFRIDGTSLTDASNVGIKPGDVVAIEHTQGSWTRLFLSQVFGFRISYSGAAQVN